MIDRAKTVLEDLERQRRNGSATTDMASVAAAGNSHSGTSGRAKKTSPAPSSGSSGEGGMQLSFFQLDDPVLKEIRDQIRGLDIDSLTPIEALNKLNEIKKLSGL